MPKKFIRYWGSAGRDEFGRTIAAEIFEAIDDEPMQHPQINQQTSIYQQPAATPIAPAPAPLQAAAPQPVMWQPQTSQSLSPFPVVAAMVGLAGIFGFISSLSQINELKGKLASQSQTITQLETQIRERDITIQSYERMAGIIK